MYSGGFIWCLGVCIWYFQGVNLVSVSGLILYCTWYSVFRGGGGDLVFAGVYYHPKVL